MTFSPDLLSDVKEFKEKTRVLIETVRNSKTKDESKVRIPGESTFDTMHNNINNGTVGIEDNLYNELKRVAS